MLDFSPIGLAQVGSWMRAGELDYSPSIGPGGLLDVQIRQQKWTVQVEDEDEREAKPEAK